MRCTEYRVHADMLLVEELLRYSLSSHADVPVTGGCDQDWVYMSQCSAQPHRHRLSLSGG